MQHWPGKFTEWLFAEVAEQVVHGPVGVWVMPHFQGARARDEAVQTVG
jgi:hypothetical protein